MNAVSKPPLQQRSRRTLAALVAAAEALLEERAFDEISIQDICAAAGCTTGSFYGRFRSKEDLLPYLYEAYDSALTARFETQLASRDWEALSLAAVLEIYVRESIASYLERPHLLREVMLFARRAPEAISPEIRARRDALHARVAAILARKAPRAPPGEAAFVLFTLGTVARELTLFGHAPMAQSTAGSREQLVRRLIWMGLVHLETRT